MDISEKYKELGENITLALYNSSKDIDNGNVSVEKIEWLFGEPYVEVVSIEINPNQKIYLKKDSIKINKNFLGNGLIQMISFPIILRHLFMLTLLSMNMHLRKISKTKND